MWATNTRREIKGYASATSVNKGGSVALFISVNPPQTYTIEVYRVGWYNGLGGRLLATIGPLKGTTQPVPPPDPETGQVECNWELSYILDIPTNWVTGQYLLKLVNAAGYQNYILLTVRDDAAQPDLLFQSAVNTYQAYNSFGGKSLYTYNSTDGVAAVKVSFDRPYMDSGSGDFLRWELGMIRFLERNGYDTGYCTNVDLHISPTILKRSKALLSVGHDEYWSRQMYDTVENARDQGVHLGFFGANAVYWQVRLEKSGKGVPNRTLVGYKEHFKDDPYYRVNDSLTTGLWRDPPLNRPENELIGVLSDSQGEWENGFPYVVKNSNHWVYSGTGFKEGDSVPGLVGYEWDNLGIRNFSPPGLVPLSASPVIDVNNVRSVANSSIYQAASGAWVFGAGTIYWSYGCDYNSYNTRYLVDSRIQRTTLNILNKFIGK